MNERRPTPAKILLLRHAEKPDRQNRGVTAEGKPGKESLSVRGWQRAGALACLLSPPNPFPQDAGEEAAIAPIFRPEFIYVSKPVKHFGSRRSLETVIPLAEKLGIRINSDFLKNETQEMLAHAFARGGGLVLVCWQREFLPQIARLILGDDAEAKAPPLSWGEDCFDVFWMFERDAAGARGYVFRQIPQNLLGGDSQ